MLLLFSLSLSLISLVPLTLLARLHPYSALAPSLPTAMGLSSIFFTVFLLFNGFFLLTSAIPGWWIWAHWASPLTYVFYAGINNEFTGVVFDCGRNSTSTNSTMVASNSTMSAGNSTMSARSIFTAFANATMSSSSSNSTSCRYKTGDDLLSFYRADNHTLLVWLPRASRC